MLADGAYRGLVNYGGMGLRAIRESPLRLDGVEGADGASIAGVSVKITKMPQ